MNRKDFLQSGVLFSAAMVAPSFASLQSADKPALIPPYLNKGDTVAIISPAGYITQEELSPAISMLTSWGFNCKIGSSIGKRYFTFGGTDEERAADLQTMLDDPQVKAILCARGGYGSVRIVDQIVWDQFKMHPKWVIGFSDVTVLHSHINHQLGVASIHSKMCNSFPDDWNKADETQKASILSIREALTGKAIEYPTTPQIQNRTGKGTGALVGGNLKTLESLAGSSSDISTDGKILFVEDTGEYMYSIDRMFWNLKRTGKLSKLKGLIVGGFKIKVDTGDDEFGKTLQELVMEKVAEYDYPVCFEFPVGHQKNNFALKCGINHTLSVQSTTCSLIESTS